MDTRTVKVNKEICKECKGNGYIRIPYHLVKEEQWADCNTCDSQGEIKKEVWTNDRA
jgi:DnaJ-class molecular chaperone